MEPRLLTLRVVADQLSISIHTARAWVRQGRLPTVRLGRCIRVKAEVAEELASGRGTDLRVGKQAR